MKMLFMLLILVAGMMAPTQAGINSHLSNFMRSNVLAALVSFCVGSMALLLYVWAIRIPWPQMQALAGAPWWVWIGGLCGAFLVTATIAAAPVLGATTMFSFFVGGQLMASLFLDHYGLLGYPVHSMNIWRIMGVVLLFGGMFLIKRF